MDPQHLVKWWSVFQGGGLAGLSAAYYLIKQVIIFSINCSAFNLCIQRIIIRIRIARLHFRIQIDDESGVDHCIVPTG